MLDRKTKRLLEASAELVVLLRSYNMHSPTSIISQRNADTGKPTGKSSQTLQAVEDAVMAFRKEGK